MASVSPPTVPAQPGTWGWDELAPRNQSASNEQIRALTNVICNLYDLLLALGSRLLRFVRLGLRALEL